MHQSVLFHLDCSADLVLPPLTMPDVFHNRFFLTQLTEHHIQGLCCILLVMFACSKENSSHEIFIICLSVNRCSIYFCKILWYAGQMWKKWTYAFLWLYLAVLVARVSSYICIIGHFAVDLWHCAWRMFVLNTQILLFLTAYCWKAWGIRCAEYWHAQIVL